MSERFVHAIHSLKQGGKVYVSIDEIGAQCDGTPIMLLRLQILAGQLKH